MPNTSSQAPELLAPAGDWDCAKAAVENGADAVYFGLQGGFNARARAVNFTADELPELMTFLRSRGVRGYLTLNTLVFSEELEEAERTARLAIGAGIDAILVQDFGLLKLLHRLCPDLPLHASTQMTLSSAECIRETQSLGVRRVVLPRELSIAEITQIHNATDIELEVFVHGALCVSYSGQCLASLSLGGRSANRGQCAQPCRLPYELLCDGKRVDLGERKYLLSPHDLAAYDRLPALLAAGVSALKIEGRMKTAEYVACVTAFYRAALDAAAAGQPTTVEPIAVAEMEVAFSRGFGHGWLDGNDSKRLVSGVSSAKRGILLGKVDAVFGKRVRVRLAAPVCRGDGVVFETDRAAETEQGGRVYEIFRGRQPVEEAESGVVELAFGHEAVDTSKLLPGQTIWKTHDPRLERRLRKSFSGPSRRNVALDAVVEAAVAKPLRITATAATGAVCSIESPEPLAEATKHALTEEVLREQLGRLGKTVYTLRKLTAAITGRPMIPLSVLGKLRHELIEQLDAATSQPPAKQMAADPVLPSLRAETQQAFQTGKTAASDSQPQLHVLCRSLEQISIALDCGAASVIIDLRGAAACTEALRIARRRFARIWLATPRIHRPGESSVFQRLADLGPDGMLVRNLAGLAFCRERHLPAIADFSLNAANELATRWLCDLGVERVTASFDLNAKQWTELASIVPPERLELVVFRHTPMFHSSYCVYCSLLSPGRNRTDCGQPCRQHDVRLRDRLGVAHPLQADSQCRNTLFHAEPTNLTAHVPDWLRRGVRHFRIELLGDESPDEVHRLASFVMPQNRR